MERIGDNFVELKHMLKYLIKFDSYGFGIIKDEVPNNRKKYEYKLYRVDQSLGQHTKI